MPVSSGPGEDEDPGLLGVCGGQCTGGRNENGEKYEESFHDSKDEGDDCPKGHANLHPRTPRRQCTQPALSAGVNANPARETPDENEDQGTLRDRVIRLAFGGDQRRYEEFLRALDDSTPDGVQVILRGSSVTGCKWKTGEPFDHDGPGTSDMDVTFVGGDMVSLFRDFHIPGVHSAPLSEAHPFASTALAPLRQRLCEMTGRPVNLQATTSLVQFLRDVTMYQPYLVLLDKSRNEEAADSSSA